MTTEKKPTEENYRLLTKEIHERELTSEDLQVEQRRYFEQVEECSWQIKQETERISTLYEELAYFGDRSAMLGLSDSQELIRQVQGTLQGQGDDLATLYQKTEKQMQETTEALHRERGALEW